MVHYEPLLTYLNVDQLAQVLIETVIKYHGLPESIVADQRSLFTSKFWSSHCIILMLSVGLLLRSILKLMGKLKDNTVQ